MTPWAHACASARRFGGTPGDYLALHEAMDRGDGYLTDARRRAVTHNQTTIQAIEAIIFAVTGAATIATSAGDAVPVRDILERHVIGELGWLPTVEDWLSDLPIQPWMALRTIGRKRNRPAA